MNEKSHFLRFELLRVFDLFQNNLLKYFTIFEFLSMNLAQPAYDAILNWDKRLEQLQNEVRQLEQEYGFSEAHIELYKEKTKKAAEKVPKPRPSANKTTNKSVNNTLNTSLNKSASKFGKTSTTSLMKESRYQNLPKVKIDESSIPKTKPKPEIDPEWEKANRTKPNLMTFFDKENYQPTHISYKDFESKPAFCSNYNYFYDYMSNFALSYTKNVKI